MSGSRLVDRQLYQLFVRHTRDREEEERCCVIAADKCCGFSQFSQSVGWLYFSFISQPYTPNREDRGVVFSDIVSSVSQ